MNFQKAL